MNICEHIHHIHHTFTKRAPDLGTMDGEYFWWLLGEANLYCWSLKTNRSVQMEGQNRKSIMLNHQQAWQQPPKQNLEKCCISIGGIHMCAWIFLPSLIGKRLEHWNPTKPPICFTREPSNLRFISVTKAPSTAHCTKPQWTWLLPHRQLHGMLHHHPGKVLRHAIRHYTIHMSYMEAMLKIFQCPTPWSSTQNG